MIGNDVVQGLEDGAKSRFLTNSTTMVWKLFKSSTSRDATCLFSSYIIRWVMGSPDGVAVATIHPYCSHSLVSIWVSVMILHE